MNNLYLLVKYAEGSATETERQQVENWLAASAANRSAYIEYLQIWYHSEASSAIDTLNVEEDLSAIKAKASFPEKQKLRPLRIWRIAAVILLLIGVSVLWMYLKMPVEPSFLLAENPSGSQPLEIQLNDGTTVTLNASSTLEYPATFTTNTRNVVLNGEAFFDVAPNPAKAFVIQTGQTEVKVLGTQFNLRAFADDARSELTVIEGKVLFAEKNNKANQLILTANQQAIFETASKQMTRQEGINLNTTSWQTGILAFENSGLEAVIADLNRHYSVDIQLPANLPPSEACRLTTQFQNQDLESVLDELNVILGMEYEKNGDTIMVTTLNCTK